MITIIVGVILALVYKQFGLLAAVILLIVFSIIPTR